MAPPQLRPGADPIRWIQADLPSNPVLHTRTEVVVTFERLTDGVRVELLDPLGSDGY